MEGNEALSEEEITNAQAVVAEDPELQQVINLANQFGGEKAARKLVKEISSKFKATPPTAEKAAAPAAAIIPDKTAAAPAGPVAEAATEESEEEDPLKDVQSSFLKDFSVKNPKKATSATTDYSAIASLEEMDKILGKVTGAKDRNAAIATITEHRKQATQAKSELEKLSKEREELANEKEGWKGMFESLPIDALEVVQAFHDGKNYKEVMRKYAEAPDYSKDFTQLDIKQLARHFRPDVNITDPQEAGYVDLDDRRNSVTKEVVRSIEEKYNAGREHINSERTKITERNSKRAASIKSSVDGSVNKFKTTFPDVKGEQIAEISAALTSGDGLDKIFKKGDGTYRTDAAERIAYGTHGLAEITSLREALNRVKSYYEKIILNGPTEMKTPGGREEQQVPPEIAAIMSWKSNGKKEGGDNFSKAKIVKIA
jgi:hypothetical protein